MLAEKENEGIHDCEELAITNLRRADDREIPVYIFKDMESLTYNMKIGLEFVMMRYCPFCGESL